jgi:hypothetical protein
MAFVTKDLPIPESGFLNERSICDPKKVIEIVSGSFLYGKQDALWQAFRFKDALSTIQRQTLLRTSSVTLTPEERACLLFDVMMQHIANEKLVYTYTSGGGGLFGSDPIDNGKINCKDCATSFASLLYAFNFYPANLFWNLSNPDDSRDIKVMAKPDVETHAATIKGYKGFDPNVPPDAANMAGVPLVNDLSNAFRLKYQRASVITEPCDRDPFLNHFVLLVSGLGFSFPYFDALAGRRYKNGQDDLFTMYHRNPAGDLHYSHGNREPVQMYAREEFPDARLYTVPHSMTFNDATFQQAKLSYADQGLFFVIDPPDWHAKPITLAQARVPAPQPLAPPPPLVIGHQRLNTFSHPGIILEALGIP